MNKPPGSRLCVVITGFTFAEFFRDNQGQDLVLLVINNISRFTQACSELYILLGRIPSADGYHLNLACEMGYLQDRITTTNDVSIT